MKPKPNNPEGAFYSESNGSQIGMLPSKTAKSKIPSTIKPPVASMEDELKVYNLQDFSLSGLQTLQFHQKLTRRSLVNASQDT
jgi:hypothetical protein